MHQLVDAVVGVVDAEWYCSIITGFLQPGTSWFIVNNKAHSKIEQPGTGWIFVWKSRLTRLHTLPFEQKNLILQSLTFVAPDCTTKRTPYSCLEIRIETVKEAI